MIKHVVNTRDELDELYKGSALTIEGLDDSDESLNRYTEWLNKNVGGFKGEPEFYVIHGETMNAEYGAYYPDDLNIVCVKLDCFIKFGLLAVKRFQIGARWFDDVVNNIGKMSW